MISFPPIKGIIEEYDVMLKELQEDCDDYYINEDDEIQILRGPGGIIIDWYYDDKTTQHDFEEAMKDGEDVKKEFQQYWRDKPKLEPVSVKEVIAEIKMNLKEWHNKGE